MVRAGGDDHPNLLFFNEKKLVLIFLLALGAVIWRWMTAPGGGQLAPIDRPQG
jgi:hypothetical protein